MKLIRYAVLIYAAIGNSAILPSNGITYSGSYANRLGDYLVSYCDCRWLSYIHNLEFYYKPFKYCDQLTASVCHKQASENTNKKEIQLTSAFQINSEDDDVLFVGDDHMIANVQIDWNDRPFVKILKSEISPLGVLTGQKIEIPHNHYAIALHVRRGGGADRKLFQEDVAICAEGVNLIYKNWPTPDQWDESTSADKIWPERFPSDIYYIEQLRDLSDLNASKKIYVHIFTDDPCPEQIAAKYEAALGNPQIQFGYRKQNNSHDTNVLEDFFSIMSFDALIRPASHYSEIAAAIGEIPYEVFPKYSRWEGRKLITTHISIIERKEGKVTTKSIDLKK